MLRCICTFVGLAVVAAGSTMPAFAATTIYSSTFEGFADGDIGTQDGWSRTVNSPTMGSITSSFAQAGSKSMQLLLTSTSNIGVANHQTSPSITGAGETGATIGGAVGGTTGFPGMNRFEASLWYRPDSAFVSNNGTRMAEFDPSSGGNRYAVARALDDGTTWSFGMSDLSAGVFKTAASGLSFDTWYRITMTLDFVDGPGVGLDSNDVFTVNLYNAGGTLLGSQIGGSWEEGYVGGGFGGGALPRVVDGMDFWGYGSVNGMSSGAIDGLFYQATTVPEPASLGLLFASAGLLLRRRR